jgi:hypothetical protein
LFYSRREKERAKEREEAWQKVHLLAKQNYPELTIDELCGTFEFEPVMGDIPENDEMNYEKIEMESREVQTLQMITQASCLILMILFFFNY